MPTSDIDLAASCARADVDEVEKASEELSDTAHRQLVIGLVLSSILGN